MMVDRHSCFTFDKEEKDVYKKNAQYEKCILKLLGKIEELEVKWHNKEVEHEQEKTLNKSMVEDLEDMSKRMKSLRIKVRKQEKELNDLKDQLESDGTDYSRSELVESYSRLAVDTDEEVEKEGKIMRKPPRKR